MSDLYVKIFLKLILFNLFGFKKWNFINGSSINSDNGFISDNTLYISNYTQFKKFIQNISTEHRYKSIPSFIDLSYSNLTYIPTELTLFENLVCLNLCNNSLHDFSELPKKHFFNLVNLETLTLGRNLISEFPNLLGKFTKLKRLDFSYNQIVEIPSSIKELTSIEIINLKNNRIKILPSCINKLTTLTSLDLSYNKLIEFPDNCFNLNNLSILDLQKNSITNITSICNIKNLKVLCLYNNRISKIPNEISKLENLDELLLSKNDISILPRALNKCKNLKKLYLSCNSITNFESICESKTLELLYLFNNRITNIPNNVDKLENLITLDLSENKIYNVPENLANCKNLNKLNLSSNHINKIETICKIKSLKHLSLSNIQISEIPDDIGNLENLKKLKLSVNDISILSKELANCKKLQFLNLRCNKIEKIPIELFNFSNLQFLDLRLNPLIYPVNSTEIDIYELKLKMDDLLKKINDWKEKYIYNESKDTDKLNILDPNEFTGEVKSFNTTILTDYIHHLYNPEDRYTKWNVPKNLTNEFKKYIGAIVCKIFSSNDPLFVEGHLNSLSTAICYCPERHKSELVFLYELLIDEDEKLIEKSQNYESGSNEYIENIKVYIEEIIKRFIGTAKMKIFMQIFNNPENDQNVHLCNYWKYVLKDHVGIDVIGDKPTIYGSDKFNGQIGLGLEAFFEKFTPKWLILELKQYINNDSNFICKISEFLYYSDIQNKIRFVECEEDDILFTKSITDEFCNNLLIHKLLQNTKDVKGEKKIKYLYMKAANKNIREYKSFKKKLIVHLKKLIFNAKFKIKELIEILKVKILLVNLNQLDISNIKNGTLATYKEQNKKMRKNKKIEIVNNPEKQYIKNTLMYSKIKIIKRIYIQSPMNRKKSNINCTKYVTIRLNLLKFEMGIIYINYIKIHSNINSGEVGILIVKDLLNKMLYNSRISTNIMSIMENIVKNEKFRNVKNVMFSISIRGGKGLEKFPKDNKSKEVKGKLKKQKEIKYNSFEEFLRMDVLKKINVKYSVPCINMDNINCNIDEFNKNDSTNNNQHVIELFKCKLRSKKSNFSNINKKTYFFISWSDFFRNIEKNINEIDKVIKIKKLNLLKFEMGIIYINYIKIHSNINSGEVGILIVKDLLDKMLYNSRISTNIMSIMENEKFRKKELGITDRIEAYIQSTTLKKTLESISMEYRRGERIAETEEADQQTNVFQGQILASKNVIFSISIRDGKGLEKLSNDL
ncbi:small gtp-binding protein [Vairimorpha apis BRL 01]|uniref:Small gtp-binding protein n=1 Tax=Vairimorpha apis BRL 01 TaxID=1037528 RepID=T0LCU3_9MICR|nr:small gtp-binding protein [Vairimorpha apis BRL 01]